MVRRSGEAIDFKAEGAFDNLATRCIALLEQAEPDLDLIILDETQDMQPEWVLAMLSRLKAQGIAVLLEDPEQQLYKDRVAFDLPEAVCVTSHENFRSPRALVKLINLLRLTTVDVEAMAPFEGEMQDPIVYESPEKIAPCTVKAVERCLQRGFSISDVAVVSMRGRERSVLLGLEKLGPWSLRRFTGQHDVGSNPIWTDGQLLIESVRRFKGQAAAAVVLTECDIAELDSLNRRLLFVGLTRARVHLEWVISKDTARVLEEALA
jgi:superfamily I DNA and RNA helicase